jgi:hemerythrin
MTTSLNVKYFLGIPEMDNEHFRLIEMMNRLEHSEALQITPQKIWKTLNDLADYIEVHFTHEETLMEQAGYPDLKAHRELHRAFSERVMDLKSRADLDAATLHGLMRQWLEEHIMGADRSYVGYVQSWQDRRGAAGGWE